MLYCEMTHSEDAVSSVLNRLKLNVNGDTFAGDNDICDTMVGEFWPTALSSCK